MFFFRRCFTLLSLLILGHLGVVCETVAARPTKQSTRQPLSVKPATPGVSKTEPSKAEAFVQNIEKAYAKVTVLKAHFEQIHTSSIKRKTLSGMMYLKKPGMMRWEYDKPKKTLFVADGKFLWMNEYEEDEPPSVKKIPLSSSQLIEQVPFLFREGKLSETFSVSLLTDSSEGQPGHVMLKLLPKKPNAKFKYLVFGVDPATFMVKETILYELQGGSNHLIFSQLELNPTKNMDDQLFSYTPTPGEKIIEK